MENLDEFIAFCFDFVFKFAVFFAITLGSIAVFVKALELIEAIHLLWES
jgi:hypothetical protein